MAIVARIWLPAGPGTAWFLSNEEKTYAVKRIQFDYALYVEHEYAESGVERDRLTKRDMWETIRDWKLWYVLVFNICASVPNTAFSVFLPLVIQGLGYSSIQANLVSPYRPPPKHSLRHNLFCTDVGAAICLRSGRPLFVFAELGPQVMKLLRCNDSDGTSNETNCCDRKERGYHIVAGILIGLIGLIAVVLVHSSQGKYAGLCIFLFGSYISAPLTVAWLSNNTPGKPLHI
jgi:hypothetical protein